MDYSLWAFVLLAIGVMLIIAEVFIPSGGVITVLATVSLLGALLCAANAWWTKNPAYFWGFVAGFITLLPLAVVGAFYIWPHTAIGRRAILEAPAPEEVASFVEVEERHAQLVGKLGQTLTLLNPGGIARVDGQRVHCQSEGMIIEAGAPIRVISAKANRLIVRRVDGEQPLAPAPHSESVARGDEPLDFDMGQE